MTGAGGRESPDNIIAGRAKIMRRIISREAYHGPIYFYNGNVATDALIAYIDSGTGLPVTPNGGDINVTVNASGWFTL